MTIQFFSSLRLLIQIFSNDSYFACSLALIILSFSNDYPTHKKLT